MLTFHKHIVIDPLERVIDSLGDLIKDLKLFTRKIYVDMLTHQNVQTILDVSYGASPKAHPGLELVF